MAGIGEAAAQTGVAAKMIRHHQAIGLIDAQRRPNGYRTCAPQDARDLALEESRRLLASAGVKRMAMHHGAVLERKAASLQAVADGLLSRQEGPRR